MDKLLVIFSRNKDRRTANLIVDGYLINEDIPFIPRLATDHRGLTLFYYCKENNISWSDLEFDVETEQLSEIKRGWDYIAGPAPVHILESIHEYMTHPRNFPKKKPRKLDVIEELAEWGDWD